MIRPAFSIYDASAGSGKTFTLAKEYLKIILTSPSDEAYKHILAITFTNKAVAEMKKRILNYLLEFADKEKHPNSVMLDEIIKDIQKDANYIQLKSIKILKNIIHNYAAFDVMTIDKFTAKVIRTFAFDFQIHPQFDISLDTETLLEEAIDALIAQAGSEQKLTDTLIDFALDKTEEDKSWDISYDLMEVGKLLTRENHRLEIEAFQDQPIEVFEYLKKTLYAKKALLEEDIKQLIEEVFKTLQDSGIERETFSAQYYPKHLDKIKSTFLMPDRKYTEDGNFKTNKNAKGKEEVVALIPYFVETNTQIYALIGKRDFILATLQNLTPLSLLQAVNKELKNLLEEKNQLIISDFNSIIHNELKNQPAPFIYERIGEYYRHYFIDEFQDTSVLQWNNLIPLIDNALSSEDHYQQRGSLMIVGDPKQSIYRFRGGRAEQLIDLTKEVNPFVNPDKKVYHLDTNWRSFDEIIAFNNAFFKNISQFFNNSLYKELYHDKSAQKNESKEGGYVSIQFVEGHEDEDLELTKIEKYLEATYETIQQCLSQGFDYKDIAILTRKREPGIQLARFLVQKNIPVLSSESLMIALSPEVSFLVTFLNYLNATDDKESLAQVLYYIGMHNDTELSLHDFIDVGLQCESEEALDRWFAKYTIQISLRQLKQRSVYEIVEFLVMKLIAPDKRDAYVQDFLDRVLEQEVKNKAGIADFLKYWEHQHESFSVSIPEGKNAITMLTIHKSKGLEFPVVIFPFADENYVKSPKDKLWVEHEEDTSLPKFLVNHSKKVETFGEKPQEVFDERNEEILLDNVNLIYVALTRAVEQLYIISSMKLTSKGEVVQNDMATFFMNYLQNTGDFKTEKFQYSFGEQVRRSKPKPRESHVHTLPVNAFTTSMDHVKIASREAVMWGSERSKAIAYGNLIHDLMSKISSRSEVNYVVQLATEEGLIGENDKIQIAGELHKIVNHPNLYEFFNPEHKLFCEMEIVRPSGGVLKPDRVEINTHNEAFILDYKTGAPQSSHLKQLWEYAESVAEMGSKLKKCCVVYLADEVNIVELDLRNI